MTLSFVKIENAILPLENSMEMKGSSAYFTDIEEISFDRYSVYAYKELEVAR